MAHIFNVVARGMGCGWHLMQSINYTHEASNPPSVYFFHAPLFVFAYNLFAYMVAYNEVSTSIL